MPAERFVLLFFSICMSREFVKLSGSLLAANFYFPQRPNREKKKGRRFAFDVRINQTAKRQKVFCRRGSAAHARFLNATFAATVAYKVSSGRKVGVRRNHRNDDLAKCQFHFCPGKLAKKSTNLQSRTNAY